MKIENLFPVQKQIIPIILNNNKNQTIYPNDLCILAPTGSGKTLTYVLPIIQNLKSRIRPCCRALVILPVSDLAEQVYNVFKTQLNENNNEYLDMLQLNEEQKLHHESKNFNSLKCLLLSNKNQFQKEQSQLVGENGKCLIDILVTTPGRLVDHLQKTKGFDLRELRYLVLDECDRIIDQIKQNWLSVLNQAIFGDDANGNKLTELVSNEVESKRKRELLNPECLNAYNLMINKSKIMPFQKLLLSATLTHNPEKLEQMSLFHPVYCSVAAEKLKAENKNEAKLEKKSSNSLVENKEANGVKKESAEQEKKEIISMNDVNVPSELNEIFIQVYPTEKSLYTVYLIKTLGYRRMLCFVKSKDAAKRLNKLLELNGIKSMEYSSALHSARRQRIQAKFEEDKLDVLVCSDVMARGMDLANVDYVLLYDLPNDITSYIHKIGRTARAGKSGTAITFLEQKEIGYFKKMAGKIGLNKEDEANRPHKVKELKIKKSQVKHLVEEYKTSLTKLKEVLKSNPNSTIKKSNNSKSENVFKSKRRPEKFSESNNKKLKK